MKKIVLSLFALATFAISAEAQKWVKTTPQNKNVILEEFTGIHCGYCPDGHRIADGIVKANPDRVFLINIHAGSFATPAAGELDLRTTEGDAIDKAAKVTGYPSGTINRNTTPWGQSRSAWASKSAAVLTEKSPVNVAVRSYVDFSTRELTTEVEVYYTSDAAKSTNYLTVALTQDDILGTQSDYGNYNPTNWVDGKYRHNHVLRQHITTGSFGIVIDTTTSGHYMYKKFTTTIPANYKGVDAVLYKMNVVAYVTETATGATVLSGAETKVDFDPNLKTDLALVDQTIKPSSFCFTQINPKIEVTNILDQVVTTFNVTVNLNGKDYVKTFTGNLAKGEKTTLDWGAIPFAPRGAYTMAIKGFQNVNNGNLYDMVETNDKFVYNSFGFTSKAFTTYKTSFEGGAPANLALDLSQNPNVKILTGSGATNYGNFGSKSAMLFYLHSSWNVAGKPGHIILGEADLSAFTDPGVGYYYAFSDGEYGGTAPTIMVSASDDCGQTWKEVGKTTCVNTGQPAAAGALYAPLNGEYKYIITSLDAYKGKNVLIKISGTPGSHGNSLYIDEINVNSAQRLGTPAKLSNTSKLVLSPNPVNNMATVSYDINKPSDVVFNVYNMLNQLVFSKTIPAQGSGSHEESFDFSGLNSGMYTLNIHSGDAVSTKKFIKN